ncbi:MAG: cytochrome c [Candidatus Sericytochromatia bacterium]|nr:cytochrome c [Candidatus Tanganyikabacteria bacterium]
MRKALAILVAAAIPVTFASAAFAAKGDAAKGKAIYVRSCAMCHGAISAGKPTLPNAADFFKGQFKLTKGAEKEMDKLIKVGGAAYGKGGTAQMPPQPQLSDKDRADVIAFIKTMKKGK